MQGVEKVRDLKADMELCKKATPGPWCEDGDGSVYSADDEDSGDICEMYFCRSTDATNANAVFIAEAREGWPEAIERAEKAEAENKKMRELLERALAHNLIPELHKEVKAILSKGG